MKKVLAICLSIFFIQCDFNNNHIKINDFYSYGYIDDQKNQTIYYKDDGYLIGIVDPKVDSIFYNYEIIAFTQIKKHNKKEIISYYLIPIKNPISNKISENILGPMEQNEFYKFIDKELNISVNLKKIDSWLNLKWEQGLNGRNIFTALAGYLHYGLPFSGLTGYYPVIPLTSGGSFVLHFSGTVRIK